MTTFVPDWSAFLPILVAPFAAAGTTLLAADVTGRYHRIAGDGRDTMPGNALFLAPVLSIAAILIAVWTGFAAPASIVWISCLFGWTLLALAIIDLRLMILPNFLTISLALAGFIVTLTTDADRFPDSVIGAAVGYAILALIRISYRKLRGRDGLGGGDAKMLGAIGAWVGWQDLSSVVLIAALCGLAIIGVSSLMKGKLDPQHRLPFGPCLAFGAWVVWLHGGVGVG
ncbi:MAG TPA: A24 family peptidase [Magnetospirillaceae bacterium]|jgi:leader peptidase (prepilin peptidase)/N-methyltransferase